MTRDLAAAAARSPSSRWEVTVVDGRGYAVGHGIARPGRGKRQGQGPRPPGPGTGALPARVNITVTETFLRHLAAQPARPGPGAPPGDWDLGPLKESAPGNTQRPADSIREISRSSAVLSRHAGH